VQSNLETDIIKATSSAFAGHLSKADAYANSNAVTSLKGIGIATGSLIMSTLDPDHVPFFGDEVFRWIMWDEPSSSPGKGWTRKIGYTPKEYRRFVELLDAFRKRVDVSAIEIEKVGYVLGRTKADLEGTGSGDVEEKKESGKRKAEVLEEKVTVEAPAVKKDKEKLTEQASQSSRSSRSKRRRHSE
jgi:hypothetical protein